MWYILHLLFKVKQNDPALNCFMHFLTRPDLSHLTLKKNDRKNVLNHAFNLIKQFYPVVSIILFFIYTVEKSSDTQGFIASCGNINPISSPALGFIYYAGIKETV